MVLAGGCDANTKTLACVQGPVGGVLASGTAPVARGSGLERDVSSESSYSNGSATTDLCTALYGPDSESDSESDGDFIVYVTTKTPEDNLAMQLPHLTLTHDNQEERISELNSCYGWMMK